VWHEVAAYADTLTDLIGSAERRKAMGAAARDRVCSHFGIEQMGNRMDELLQRAQQWHRARPRARVGVGLGAEHAVLALEYERLARAAERLWKYSVFETKRWELYARLSPWLRSARRIVYHLSRPMRKVKDRVWIVGHKIKVRVRHLGKAG